MHQYEVQTPNFKQTVDTETDPKIATRAVDVLLIKSCEPLFIGPIINLLAKANSLLPLTAW